MIEQFTSYKIPDLGSSFIPNDLMKHLLSSLLILTFVSCSPIDYVSRTVKSNKFFSYTNPITNGIEGGIRDAQVFFDNGKYYMTGTSAPFWEGANPGVKLYSSDDLLNWKFEKLLIDRAKLDPSVWYYDRFWAPEIHKIKQKYYLLFNSRNQSERYKHSHGTAVAVADQLTGPYRILSEKKPFTGGNDLSFFEDTNGKVYAYWNGAKVMNAAEVDMGDMSIIGKPTQIFTPDPGTWDQIGIEGPYMFKRDGIYYLMYSSWTRGYEIGYATSRSPLGPFVKYINNPVYGAQSKEACQKAGLPFTGDINSPFRAVGHNEVFKGPDGRLWLSAHGIVDGKDPSLVIDPIDFDPHGNIIAINPSYTTQTIKIKK